MKRQTWIFLAISALIFLLGTGVASAQSRLTIAIECGAQGQVDDPHRLTVTVTNTATNQDTTVTIPVQAQTDSSAVADTLATVLDKKGISGTTSSETTNKRYGSSKHKAEDVEIPAGYKVKKVKVEKQKKDNGPFECDDGHLQAYIGKKQVSNKARSDDRAASVSGPVGSLVVAPQPVAPFKTLAIEILGNDASDLIFVLDLYAGGGSVNHSFEKTFRTGTSAADALKEVGTFLASLGAFVAYPGVESLEADLSGSSLGITEAYFSAQAVEQVPYGESRTIEFSFDAN